VLDDLEFQLTLQTKLEPPALPTVTAAPVKTVTQKKSHSAFRNLLSSPKKRKEQERKLQEEAEREALQQQQQQEALTKRNQQATAWDLLHDLVGPDGSFARAYVCLKNYEDQAYGRPLTVDIPCFNEWAVDDASASSVKSKRGGVVRRPPYRIGKLTVQLLYVPKPKNAKDEDMPKSMNACIRELKEAEEIKAKSWEGVLSQQGGDCPVSSPRTTLNFTKLIITVLASSLLPSRWYQADSLPRDHSSASRNHQSSKGCQAHRRQDKPQATFVNQERWTPEVSLCGRRGRLHVC
jgi:hypothetical protein